MYISFLYFRTLEGCVDGAKTWHETFPVCPGYNDTLENGKYNEDLANYFYKQSGFQWMTCFEESFQHDVEFGFPKDVFIDDYEDINSEAAKRFIDEKMALVNSLINSFI